MTPSASLFLYKRNSQLAFRYFSPPPVHHCSLSLSLSLHTKIAMVIPLGPGKFYGSSLPRPRFLKADADRVSPPVPVLDPLLSWAGEAHWSMGGLSFQRLRLQGRIEGSVKKLLAEQEKSIRAKGKISKTKRTASDLKASKPQIDDSRKRAGSVSPPPAPMARKRKRYMALVDESEEEDDDEVGRQEKESEVRVEKKRPARKLYEEFDRVAMESEKAKSNGSDAALPKTRVKKGGDGIGDEVMKVVEDVNREVVEEGLGKRKLQKKSGGEGAKRVSPRSAKGTETSPSGATAIRTSPRLAKRG